MGVISMIVSLKDKVSPALNKIEKTAIANIQAYESLKRKQDMVEKSMLDLYEAGLSDTVMMQKLKDANMALGQSMDDVLNGTSKLPKHFENEKAAVDPLTQSLIRLAKAYIGIQGARRLMSMSDTYVQTHARLGMITEDVDGLEKQIYQSAQRTRVSTQSLSETVTKLGMQAGEAFNNDTNQILAFTETLNKAFTVSGMNANSIASVMYNMTQSLSTGRLLGNDYRILKMNAPMIVKYLRQYYGDIAQSELDAMVTAGKVTAQDLKNAMFKASDDINKKFEEMPVTFEQAWTKFKNSVQRLLIPVLKSLSKVADFLDKFFTILSENKYIMYAFAAAIGLITLRMAAYKVAALADAFATNVLGNAAALASLKFSLWVSVIAIAASALIYLWNTNDEAAEKMIKAWDSLLFMLKALALGFESIVWFVLKVAEILVTGILYLLFPVLGLVNSGVELLNALDGGNRKTIKIDFTSGIESAIDNKVAEMDEFARQANMTRGSRVKDRKKLGYEEDIMNSIGDITSLIDTDASGGAALKTTTSDNLLKDEDIQLLLDVATRDFKLNYQHITPEIAVTFGDVHETADVEKVMEKIADAMEEIYAGDLEAVSYGY